MADYEDMCLRLGDLEPAYRRFNAQVIAEQARFMRTGQYNPQPLEPAFVRDTYLPGLLASWLRWPHQAELVRWFRTEYLPLVRDADFYDVGFGTGLFSRLALEETQPGVTAVGYELSEEAAAFAERHLRAYGVDARFEARIADVTVSPPPARPSLLCVEVIEHLDDPVALLRALRRMCDGRAFITTALNAPNRDHVHLYRTLDEVGQDLEAAAFRILRMEEWRAVTGPASVAAAICVPASD
jgi:2-polyprenyl-3-methyl-5-hydroxy-6-metoxy-1,4-benzoquinol methylase